jgi:hypothetical protein
VARVSRESAALVLSGVAAACGIAAIVTRPFLIAPIGVLALLTATKLSSDRRLTGSATLVLALGALAGAAVAVGFTHPLY